MDVAGWRWVHGLVIPAYFVFRLRKYFLNMAVIHYDFRGYLMTGKTKLLAKTSR